MKTNPQIKSLKASAAGIAAGTRGRARTFEDKKRKSKNAKWRKEQE